MPGEDLRIEIWAIRSGLTPGAGELRVELGVREVGEPGRLTMPRHAESATIRRDVHSLQALFLQRVRVGGEARQTDSVAGLPSFSLRSWPTSPSMHTRKWSR